MPDDVLGGHPAARSRHYVAPWYLAYLILGLVHSGLLPFLLPLAVAGAGQGLDSIAYVIGAYYAGLLPAPLLGMLAERRRLFRPIFFGGFVALAAGLVGMPEIARLGVWMALAMLAGFGVGAVATVAPLFVVDFAPKPEWEARIGWLQSCNGAGQLAGLLLAGWVAGERLAWGFWLAAGFALLALVVGHVGLPADGHCGQGGLPRLDWRQLMATFHPAPAAGGLLQQSHHLQDAAWRGLPAALGGEFARFLLAWAALNLGIAPFFAYYPLMMEQSYGVAPRTTALLYAMAAGIGIASFVLSGRIAQLYGPRLVLQLGLALRMSGFAVLAALLLVPRSGAAAAAMLGFVLVMLAWPVLSVSGTGLAARLTPIGEGAAMGLLATSNALATVFGTFLGGPLVDAFGYRVVPLVALAGLLGAEILVRRSKGADGA